MSLLILILAASSAGGTAAKLLSSKPAAATAQSLLPHVVLMLADDLGNYEVGFHNPLAITPNIDALAAEGIILERHYVYHMCGPTRAATMSGRLPYHGNQNNANDLNTTAGVDLRMTMLPTKLKCVDARVTKNHAFIMGVHTHTHTHTQTNTHSLQLCK
jgi:hypothetical protein